MSSNFLPLLQTPNSFNQSQLWICKTLWCNQPPVRAAFSIAITSRMLPLHRLCGQILVWVQPHTFLSPDNTVTSQYYFTIAHTAALPIKCDMTNATLNCTSGNLDLCFIRLCIKCRSHCNTRVHLSPKSPENNADEARCRTGTGTSAGKNCPVRWLIWDEMGLKLLLLICKYLESLIDFLQLFLILVSWADNTVRDSSWAHSGNLSS